MNTTKPIQTLRRRRAEHAKLDRAKQWKQHGQHRREARPPRMEIDTIVEVLVSDAHVDCLVMQLRPGSGDPDDERRLNTQIEALARAKERSQKPVAAIVYSSTPLDEGPAIADIDKRLREIGIPMFSTYERAATVLAKVSAYYRFCEAPLAAANSSVSTSG